MLSCICGGVYRVCRGYVPVSRAEENACEISDMYQETDTEEDMPEDAHGFSKNTCLMVRSDWLKRKRICWYSFWLAYPVCLLTVLMYV